MKVQAKIKTLLSRYLVLPIVHFSWLNSACMRLPPLSQRVPSKALLDHDATKLGKAVSPLALAHPGLSGHYPLKNPQEAFAARMLLAQAAERSLDVQYYIWRHDMTGTLLFEALLAAADRGVRVRLLLDDLNTKGLDSILAALDAHANIEVRLFNPLLIRKQRLLNTLTDFDRSNRRMHNKSFTADNEATIIGGRNIGDEYFGAPNEVLFVDLDVLSVGQVVSKVSDDFDRYWASDSAYPVDRLLPAVDPTSIGSLTAESGQIKGRTEAGQYMQAVRHSSLVQELIQGTLSMEWAETHLVSDDPAKGLGQAPADSLLLYNLIELLDRPKVEVALISPYFVPTAAGVESFSAMVEQGVRVKVLTNSLEATDVVAVHAGYAKHRRSLLEKGIQLFELRRSLSDADQRKSSGLLGSSSASLHAKTFAVDRTHIFIGSFNFDPRSAKLNTEMGFVIKSPALAQQINDAFMSYIPDRAYEVQLAENGDLQWLERNNGELVKHVSEPGASLWQRASIWLLNFLPIEWLL